MILLRMAIERVALDNIFKDHKETLEPYIDKSIGELSESLGWEDGTGERDTEYDSAFASVIDNLNWQEIHIIYDSRKYTSEQLAKIHDDFEFIDKWIWYEYFDEEVFDYLYNAREENERGDAAWEATKQSLMGII